MAGDGFDSRSGGCDWTKRTCGRLQHTIYLMIPIGLLFAAAICSGGRDLTAMAIVDGIRWNTSEAGIMIMEMLCLRSRWRNIGQAGSILERRNIIGRV